MNGVQIVCLVPQRTIDRLNKQFGLHICKPCPDCKEVYVTREKPKFDYARYQEAKKLMEEMPRGFFSR